MMNLSTNYSGNLFNKRLYLSHTGFINAARNTFKSNNISDRTLQRTLENDSCSKATGWLYLHDHLEIQKQKDFDSKVKRITIGNKSFEINDHAIDRKTKRGTPNEHAGVPIKMIKKALIEGTIYDDKDFDNAYTYACEFEPYSYKYQKANYCKINSCDTYNPDNKSMLRVAVAKRPWNNKYIINTVMVNTLDKFNEIKRERLTINDVLPAIRAKEIEKINKFNKQEIPFDETMPEINITGESYRFIEGACTKDIDVQAIKEALTNGKIYDDNAQDKGNDLPYRLIVYALELPPADGETKTLLVKVREVDDPKTLNVIEKVTISTEDCSKVYKEKRPDLENIRDYKFKNYKSQKLCQTV